MDSALTIIIECGNQVAIAGVTRELPEERAAFLKTRLGETHWVQLWVEGRKMRLNEIGAYAREI